MFITFGIDKYLELGTDNKLYVLHVEKPSGDSTIVKHTFKKGWGSDTGKTILLFRQPLNVQSLKIVSEIETAKGVITFREYRYTHGTHIADRTFYEFAFDENGNYLDYKRSSPWDNPEKDFESFKRTIAKTYATI